MKINKRFKIFIDLFKLTNCIYYFLMLICFNCLIISLSFAQTVNDDSINYFNKLFKSKEYVKALKVATSTNRFKEDQELANKVGFIYMKINKHKEAKYWFLRAININPKHYLYHYNLALACTYLKDYDTALSIFETTRLLNPKFEDTYLCIAWINITLNKKIQAIETLKLSISNVNEPTKSFFELGNIYLSLNKLDEALMYYDYTLKLKPGFYDANNNKALVYLKKADILADKREYSLARFNIDKAIECNRQVIKYNPNDKTAHYSLGGLYYRLKDYKEAKQEMEKQCLVNPNYEDTQEILRKLNYPVLLFIKDNYFGLSMFIISIILVIFVIKVNNNKKLQ